MGRVESGNNIENFHLWLETLPIAYYFVIPMYVYCELGTHTIVSGEFSHHTHWGLFHPLGTANHD